MTHKADPKSWLAVRSGARMGVRPESDVICELLDRIAVLEESLARLTKTMEAITDQGGQHRRAVLGLNARLKLIEHDCGAAES